MPRPKKYADKKKRTTSRRTYKKKAAKKVNASRKSYTRSRDPSYAASSRQLVNANAKSSHRNPVPTHFSETVPLGTPNRNHWRALVMAPAHIMGLLAKFPQLGKYSQCRIPDFQIGDSTLVPAISKGSFRCVSGGAAIGFVYPSLETMADSTTNIFMVDDITNPGTPVAYSATNNRAWADVYAAGALARCVGYCVEIKGLDSATNLSGRIGMVNLPSDPFNKLPVSTIDDLANQSSAITVLSKEGCNMTWFPDANCTAIRYSSGMTAGNVDIYSQASSGGLVDEYTWRYGQFMPNGLRTDGLKATTLWMTPNPPATNAIEIYRTHLNATNISFKTGTTAVTGSNSSMRLMDMLPCIMFVVDGAYATGNFMFNVYSHWEVVPNTRGKLSEPGAVGQHSSSGTGLLSKAEHIVATVAHDIESVASTVIHTGERVASVIGTAAKVAGEIGAVVAMI